MEPTVAAVKAFMVDPMANNVSEVTGSSASTSRRPHPAARTASPSWTAATAQPRDLPGRQLFRDEAFDALHGPGYAPVARAASAWSTVAAQLARRFRASWDGVPGSAV
jgi:hypothetical protein